MMIRVSFFENFRKFSTDVCGGVHIWNSQGTPFEGIVLKIEL